MVWSRNRHLQETTSFSFFLEFEGQSPEIMSGSYGSSGSTSCIQLELQCNAISGSITTTINYAEPAERGVLVRSEIYGTAGIGDDTRQQDAWPLGLGALV